MSTSSHPLPVGIGNDSEDLLQSMLKDRGFFMPSFSAYGGFSHLMDYGPLGVLLKRNLKDLWWKHFVTQRDDMYALDTPILSPESLWRAAGHLNHFTDPLIQCQQCKHIYRADHLLEDPPSSPPPPSVSHPSHPHPSSSFSSSSSSSSSSPPPPPPPPSQDLASRLLGFPCPHCQHPLPSHDIRHTNLMFSTTVGPQQHSQAPGFLRPETAQGIFVNFHHVLRAMRPRLPFGIAQAGKAFRNELNPGNYLFRLREFEQLEIEYFAEPAHAPAQFSLWVGRCHAFLQDALGISPARLRLAAHPQCGLAHYSSATTDIEFRYSFGWKELWGVANRTDHDLRQHAAASSADLRFHDPLSGARFFPHVIEPSVGVERLVYAVLSDAYRPDFAAEAGEAAPRAVLRISAALSPYLLAVLPLLKDARLVQAAQELLQAHLRPLARGRAVDFDATGSVGRRYRRHDQIGTPFCAVVDHQSLEDRTFTVRFRDSMEQVRLPMDQKVIEQFLKEHVPYY